MQHSGRPDADGYQAKLWDAETGAIDPEVAKCWRDHYDLRALLQRDWERLGPRLQGKLHVTMGTKDTFYLDAAAHRLEQFLESTKQSGKGPYYGGSFEFGNNEPHCYPGKIPEKVPFMTHFVRVFAEYIGNTAPRRCGFGLTVTVWGGLTGGSAFRSCGQRDEASTQRCRTATPATVFAQLPQKGGRKVLRDLVAGPAVSGWCAGTLQRRALGTTPVGRGWQLLAPAIGS
jgi:hypothetical protein